ncbi:hypothetical protein GALMADRAFT_724746 [Galerina marginata CBS 339.88]|uniref:Uncharacterized protein n=1 Tax=Galerina marginata (strain CBS 339.88) TaxID=685588 RepID=A0A067T2E9_GALM3|nr:hypothetical protein GALMADRAFT_724746 [Galerina marginata CBS 339.88]
MGDANWRFYVLVANEVIQVGAGPDFTLSALVTEMKAPHREPPALLKRTSYKRCIFYKLNNPIPFSEATATRISEIMTSLQDRNKYEKLEPSTQLKNIAQNFSSNHLHLVIEFMPDEKEKCHGGAPVDTGRRSFKRRCLCGG